MTDRLHDLLVEIAEPVGKPDLAWRAWTGSQRLRRRRRATAAAAAALGVVAVIGAVVLVSGGSSGKRATPAVSRTPTAAALVQVAPAFAEEARLPRLDTVLGSLDLSAPDRLSARPVRRAAALLQQRAEGPVLVVGDDGKVRWLDGVTLQPVRDAGGNTSWPTKDTSLSPDGTKAAFPQPDRLVVADLTTGLTRTYTAPGLNEWVLWAPGTTDVLVGSATTAYRVNTLTGDRTRIAVPTGRPAFDGPTRVELLDAPAGVPSAQGGAATVRSPYDGRVVERSLTFVQIVEWWGSPHLTSSQVAAAGFTANLVAPGLRSNNPEAVAVLDARTGEPRRLLAFDLDGGRFKGCCPVLGWYDDHTVLIGSNGIRVLAWDIQTGDLFRVADLEAPVVSLASLIGN